MIGPRTFLDKDGRRWFLGISADECGDDMDSVAQEQAQDFAEMFAKSTTAFSVMGDVESYKTAKLMVNTYRNALTGEAQEKAMKSVETQLRQTLEKKSIRGMQPVHGENHVHAIANREIYVAAYAIDSNSAEAALEGEIENYATKLQDEVHQSVEKGRKAVNEAAVEAVKNRSEDVASGAAQQGEALKQELDKRNAERNPPRTRVQGQEPAPADKTEKPTGPTRGIFGGDADVSDDF